MRSINKVTLVGHVGDAPKVNNLSGDTKVVHFPLATNESYTDKDGKVVENTTWHRITAWNKRAGVIGEYVKKGDRLYVEGRIRTSDWEDKEGNKRYSIEIICDDFLFLSSKNNKGQ